MMRHSYLASVLAAMVIAAPALAVKKPTRPKPTKLEIGVYLASEFDAATTYDLLQNCTARCYEATLWSALSHAIRVSLLRWARALQRQLSCASDGQRRPPPLGKGIANFAICVHTGAGAQALALAH